MQVYEEPFMSRDAILAVFKPGLLPTEAPFRTLRSKGWVTEGLRIDVRNVLGRFLGKTQLYSSLNTDAARAARLQQFDLAKRFATQAAALESSREARSVHEAIRAIASTLPADPFGNDAPEALRRYVYACRHSWRGLDREALARQWVVHSSAWFSEEDQELKDAVIRLGEAATKARAEILNEHVSSSSTFFGVVRRLDGVSAEIEGEAESQLMPLDELKRQGLASVGQAVALLCEVLPAGGTLVIPMPAVDVDPVERRSIGPWGPPEGVGVDAFEATILPEADFDWLSRDLGKEPHPAPAAPIRRT